MTLSDESGPTTQALSPGVHVCVVESSRTESRAPLEASFRLASAIDHPTGPLPIDAER